MIGERIAVLLCCAAAGLGLGACGGEESTVDPTNKRATPSPEERETQEGEKGSSSPAPADGKKRSAGPQRSRQPASKQAPADEKPSGGGQSKVAHPPEELTDEERCERKPASCAPKDIPPDYSNPDVRRAEKRAEEPDEPPKCDSTDCEEQRRAEG